MRNILLVLLALFLSGCSLAKDTISQAIPQDNSVTVILKKEQPGKAAHTAIVLKKVPKFTAQEEHEFRTIYLMKALEEVGITNYELVDENSIPKDCHCVLVLKVDNWEAKKDYVVEERTSTYSLWATADATMFDRQTNEKLVWISGTATGSEPSTFNMGEVISNLFVDMLEEMYS